MAGEGTHDRWSPERADEWQRRTGWLTGCNYTPAYAANQIELWSRELFDPAAIARELTDAQGLGFDALRVYLHDLAYAADPAGMLERLERFLELAGSRGLGVVPVIFDSVWQPFPQVGRQPEPRRGVHNAGWVQSPGVAVLCDPARFSGLEGYVRTLMQRFGGDERVLFWDLWNEPDNANAQAYGTLDLGAGKGEIVRPLLEQVFAWSRAAAPMQPLTSGLWAGSWEGSALTPLQRVQVESSDIVTFHCYDDAAAMTQRIASLRRFGRPLVCTEYMARPRGSAFAAILPLLAEEGVGAISWGLHRGRTQTHLAWETWDAPCVGEPEVWFHDILWPDGRPYRKEEVELIRRVTQANDR